MLDKIKICHQEGNYTSLRDLVQDSTEEELLNLIEKCNYPVTSGVIVVLVYEIIKLQKQIKELQLRQGGL